MALSIKHPEAARLAHALARATGESLSEAVTTALRERLLRETGWNPDDARDQIESLVADLARAPVLDDRTPGDILGYDDHGLPS